MLTRTNWIAPLWYSPAVLLPILLLGLGCGVSMFRDTSDFLAWYFLCYVGIFLLWPFDPGPRAILPVFPLAFLYSWRGAAWFAKMASHGLGQRSDRASSFRSSFARFRGSGYVRTAAQSDRKQNSPWSFGFYSLPPRPVTVAPLRSAPRSAPRLDMVFPADGVRLGKALNGPISRGPGVDGFGGAGSLLQLSIGIAELVCGPIQVLHYPSVDAAKWIASNALPTEVVMAGQESIVHRISGRRVILFPVSSNPQMIMDVLRNQGVRYLIVLEETNKHPFFFPTEDQRWRSLFAGYPEAFRLVRQGLGYEIYHAAGESQSKPAN